MEFGITGGKPWLQRTGCVVLGVHERRELPPATQDADAACGSAISAALEQGDLEGRIGSTLLLRTLPGLACERVLLVGLGPRGAFQENSYREALAAAVKALAATGAADAVLCLQQLAVKGRDSAWRIGQAVLAVVEGLYRFEGLKTKPAEPAPGLRKVLMHVPALEEHASAREAVRRAAAIGEGITLARDLGNLPGNLCTPSYLAQRAHELGQRHGFEVTVLEKGELEALGMGAFLAVARGSLQPPKLIVMQHLAGAEGAPPVVLVGKGLTFDAGGISIKPALEMDEMKFDMCGAASVFGALHAAALMELPVNVVGIVPATENMPSGDAIKPGDVVTTMSGQTVEILDTDAEGRLVLCDALTYAERYGPAVLVDIATLTGAVVTALGHVATGLFTADDMLATELLDAGDRAWDRAWRLPLWEDYQEALKSNFADFANVGPATGDGVIAACFLSRFTAGYPWAHLDIAGTAARSGEHKGATGRPVGLLVEFLVGRADGVRQGN